jgi:hypothetical protein
MSNHIAVTDAMKGAAGRIVYWRLSGEIDYDRLVELWEAADLDDALIPNPTTADRALRLALDTQKERHLLVRTLPNSKGYALVREYAIGNSLGYSTLLHVALDKSGDVPALLIDTDVGISEAQFRDVLHDRIVEEYERRLDTLDSMAVSSWFANKVLPSVSAVGLRDRGGIYFVPANKGEAWNEIVRIVDAASNHTIFQIPAMPSAEAVHAILDALTTRRTTRSPGWSSSSGSAKTTRPTSASALSPTVARCALPSSRSSAPTRSCSRRGWTRSAIASGRRR